MPSALILPIVASGVEPFMEEYFLKCIKSKIIRCKQIHFFDMCSQILNIRDNISWIKLQYKDIIYFEKIQKKIKVVTEVNEYSFYGSLDYLRNIINMNYFFQCHQGFIFSFGLKILKTTGMTST